MKNPLVEEDFIVSIVTSSFELRGEWGIRTTALLPS